MKDEVGQKKYCIVISIIVLILGIIGFIIEYFVMNRFDIIWIVFLVIDIIILFVNLLSKSDPQIASQYLSILKYFKSFKA